MTKEEISNKAEEYAFRVPYNGTNDFYDNDALKHFTAGAEWAMKEMENVACEFAEWVGARYELQALNRWSRFDNPFTEPNWTTSELYQIYKQQKPCTESK